MPAKSSLPGLPSAVILLLLVTSLPILASADNYAGGIPPATVQTGTVSGGLYVDANTPNWGLLDVTKTFTAIPNTSSIQWARLYVAVYNGNMQNAYQGTAAITIDGNGDGTFETVLGTEDLNVAYGYPGEGGVGPVTVNDHCNRVTSDYLMWYNVTSLITSTTPKARVVTTKVNPSFDGRIKAITLVVAYNDGDSDQVYYWVNQGHDVDSYYSDQNLGEDYAGKSTFDLSRFSGTVESATLTVNHLASTDGTYTFRGTSLPTDPAGGNYQGAYFGSNIWNVTDLIQPGSRNELTYDRGSAAFYKIPLATLAVKIQSTPPLQPPVAQFGASPKNGTAPLTVSFTDQSTNTPTSWKWEYRATGTSAWTEFGSGAKNPLYTLSAAGTYDIRLTVSNRGGSDDEIKTGYITVNEAVIPPVAGFSANPISGPAPLIVRFTDQTINTPISWKWEFKTGDGIWTQFATMQNPSFEFTAAGAYSVKLTVKGPGGSDTEVKTNYIIATSASNPDTLTVSGVILSPPVANFTMAPTSGTAPLAVQFTDASIGAFNSIVWAFGDGITTTEQNPIHTFTSPGTYSVNLTVSGPGGASSITKPGLITVTADSASPQVTSPTIVSFPPPVASFTAAPFAGRAPLTVQFSDTSAGDITSRSWDFENDNTVDSILQNPSHTYIKPGTYTVTLSVTGRGGTDRIAREDLITVSDEKLQDLSIVSIIPNAGAVFVRSSNVIKVGVKNTGQNITDATALRLTASDGYTDLKEIAPINGGETTWALFTDPTVRQTIGIPVTYTAIVDPDGTIQETNEANNNRSITKTVVYNGYRGKRYGLGGDLITRRSFDLNGSLVYSAGDSRYQSGTTDGGWSSYTVSWTSSDLPISENATVEAARLYVPYTWDNSGEVPDRFHVAFNGQAMVPEVLERDQAYFGAYADYQYGLLVYDVSSSFRKDGNQVLVRKDSPGSKVSPYGMTLAVVYRDISLPRAQIYMVEGFDLLGADPDNYATTPEQATAYLSITGPSIEPAKIAHALLTTFVPSGNGPEGDLLFNDRIIASSVWDYGAASGTQVAVDTRDVRDFLHSSGNEAAIRSSLNGATPVMAASHAFLLVTYPMGGSSPDVTPTPTPTPAPSVNQTANITVTQSPSPTPSLLAEQTPSTGAVGQTDSSLTDTNSGGSSEPPPNGSSNSSGPLGGARTGASPLSAIPSPLSTEGAIFFAGIPSSGVAAWLALRSSWGIRLQ